MKHIIYVVCILTALISQSCYSEVSVETRESPISIKLVLEKTEYFEGEPIIATSIITNISENAIKLVEPSWYFESSRFEIKQIEGEVPLLISNVVGSKSTLPDEILQLFDTKESMFTTGNLDVDIKNSIPIGKYTVRAWYYVPDHINSDWHGKIFSPEIEINVIKCPEEYRLTSEAFKKLTYWWHTSDRDRKELQDIGLLLIWSSKIENGGPFAKYSLYQASDAFGLAGYKEHALLLMKDYIVNFGDTPFYGNRAKSVLIERMLHSKDFVGAREYISQLPEVIEKKTLLKNLNLLMTKTNVNPE